MAEILQKKIEIEVLEVIQGEKEAWAPGSGGGSGPLTPDTKTLGHTPQCTDLINNQHQQHERKSYRAAKKNSCCFYSLSNFIHAICFAIQQKQADKLNKLIK